MRKICLENLDLSTLDKKEKVRLIDFCEKNIINLNTFLSSIQEYEHCYNLVLKIAQNVCTPSQLEVYLNHIQSTFIICEMNKLINLYDNILKEINPNTTIRKIDFEYLNKIDNIKQDFLKITNCFKIEDLKEEYDYIKMLSKKAILSDRLVVETHRIKTIEHNQFYGLSKLVKVDTKKQDIISSISGDSIFTLQTGSIYSAIHIGLELYYCFLKDNYLS